MIKTGLPAALLAALLLALTPCGASEAHTLQAVQTGTGPVAIDMLATPDIGGIKQVVKIKTDDASKPVLLFLSGGPGSSMIANGDAFTTILKDKFTIVHWDQRDAGRTLKLNPSPIRPSIALMEQDTLEVVQFIRKELKKDKIYVLGSSWGNVLGFYLVRQHPQLLHAYFAVNPVISQLASEQALLKTLQAHFKDNAAASAELAGVQIPFKSDDDMFYLRKWLFFKDGKAYATSPEFKTGFLQWSTNWSPVWNQVMAVDLPTTLKTVACPVYFFVGKDDIQTSTAITREYAEKLQAPKKALFVFEKSGHQIHHDEPEKMQQTILTLLGALPPGQ